MISGAAILRTVIALLLGSAATMARAETPADTTSCLQAGLEAEQTWGLPPGLLAAIGRVESGRHDAASGRVLAWPWSINAQGTDYVFASRDEAIQAVRDLRMRGMRSIDAGCFQINLMYHADAFASLEQAFDPRANADYAAKFLSALRARGGSWELAIAWYHSATPGVGDRYRDRILALLAGGDPTLATGITLTTSRSFSMPVTTSQGDAYVVRLVAQTTAIRVWSPSAIMPVVTTLAHAPKPVLGSIAMRGGAGRLPRIITLSRT